MYRPGNPPGFAERGSTMNMDRENLPIGTRVRIDYGYIMVNAIPADIEPSFTGTIVGAQMVQSDPGTTPFRVYSIGELSPAVDEDPDGIFGIKDGVLSALASELYPEEMFAEAAKV